MNGHINQTRFQTTPPRRWHRRWLAVLGVPVAIVWLLHVSRPGTVVSGCAQGCATAAPRNDATLRVMSLNVLHGFPRFGRLRQRLDGIADEIRRQDVDIACLQEVPWTPHLGSAARYLALKSGLNYLYLRANGNRRAILFEEGEAILSRYPLRHVASRELLPRAGLFEHRVVLWATAVTPWGDLNVFVTHLTHGDPEINRAQVASLKTCVGQAGELPSIVAGDLNATEDDLQIATAGWTDTYRAANPEDQGYTCCIEDLSTRSEENLAKRIDYVFLVSGSEPIEVEDSRRVLDHPVQLGGSWLWASDHVGVLTTLSVQRRIER
jgi:endonuclease/exonuclease/phosphatase family metal-dependent hydrolase